MRVHGLFECSSKSPFSVDAKRVFDPFDRSRILDCDFSHIANLSLILAAVS
jgi:hypothetical protein